MKTFKMISLAVILLFVIQPVRSQEKDNKVQASTKVLAEFSKMKESIPREMFEVTEGIIIIPKMVNAGFVVGGKRGKGIAIVKQSSGSWSDPVFVTLTGGSVGLQAGVQTVDLVLIFKNEETLRNIGTGSFTLGGDVSVTAGPVGRNSSASTDYKLEAEVYSYSKTKGLFAGISLSGSSLDIDEKAITSYYGKDADAKTVFDGESKGSFDDINVLKKTLNNLFVSK